ncbi:MAG: Uncharacterised protein [Hyphomonas sp. TMED17]|nr:MAG: Uncharacterised protein [Hyphomonas sp. TMED17]
MQLSLKLSSPDNIKRFVDRFREKYVSVDLVRIGGDSDGGYLLPDNLKGVNYCFSAGVSHTSDFEGQLSKDYGIKSFMADASVTAPAHNDDNFHFRANFIGSSPENGFITLSDWIEDCIGDDASEKVLQMDIEGGEYDVLAYESAENFAAFSTLIIEFHMVQTIAEYNFLQMVSAIFEKLYLNFSIAHVHPNNTVPVQKVAGVLVPRIMEVTFIRNDLVDRFRNHNDITLPHPLDRKNETKRPDIVMPEIWWAKAAAENAS